MPVFAETDCVPRVADFLRGVSRVFAKKFIGGVWVFASGSSLDARFFALRLHAAQSAFVSCFRTMRIHASRRQPLSHKLSERAANKTGERGRRACNGQVRKDSRGMENH
jgi:hypothetical protein